MGNAAAVMDAARMNRPPIGGLAIAIFTALGIESIVAALAGGALYAEA